MKKDNQTIFDDKENELVLKFFSIIDEFASVTRYSKNRPIKEENNLEHTGFVTLFSYLIGIDLQNQFNIKIDFGKLLSGAVCHDMDETLTGDIPRPTKYYSKELRETIGKVELDSIKKLAGILGHKEGSKNLIDDWMNAKGTATVEQVIVKMADLVGVIYKVWQEMIMLNNNCFLQVAEEIIEIIKSHILNGLGTEFPEIELYFLSHLRDCLSLLETCIDSAHPNSGVMPRFIRFP